MPKQSAYLKKAYAPDVIRRVFELRATNTVTEVAFIVGKTEQTVEDILYRRRGDKVDIPQAVIDRAFNGPKGERNELVPMRYRLAKPCGLGFIGLTPSNTW